jgi:subtilisin family serine protease
VSPVASGRGVRVAVVDSGIDASHPWLATATIVHHQVERVVDSLRVVEGSPSDLSGHGTACAGIIHRMVPEAGIVDLRVLDSNGHCSRDALLVALRHCVKERYEVVNLSLGVDVPRSQPLRPSDNAAILELYEIADAAYTRGVVLIAAGPNVAAFRTYPGKSKSLIGVGRAPFAEPEMLRSMVTADYEIVAPGENVLAPALGGGERRWTGTSFAVPHVAAHVARIRAGDTDLPIEGIKASLHALARSASVAAAAASGAVAGGR